MKWRTLRNHILSFRE